MVCHRLSSSPNLPQISARCFNSSAHHYEKTSYQNVAFYNALELESISNKSPTEVR
jgi:hypothetical protein